MQHYPAFRITEDDVDDLREHTRDQSIIDAYAKWVSKSEEVDTLIRNIENAFTGLPLGDGTGLLEANGLDDYASADELAELRSRDEQADWRRIDLETLNRCYAAPVFMNARGFIFHLPAFLIAELNDKFDYGFIDRLYEIDKLPYNWIPLLDDQQRDAIIAVLSTVVEHPDYCIHKNEIEIAITRYTKERGITKR